MPTTAADCLEPGIDLANSILGSGWFYSGHSGFHPPFLKRDKKKRKEKITKRNKKHKK